MITAEDDVGAAAQFDMPDEAWVKGEAGDIKMACGKPRRDVFVILQHLLLVAVRPLQFEQAAQLVVVRHGERCAAGVKEAFLAPAHDGDAFDKFDFHRIRPALVHACLGNPVKLLDFAGEQRHIHMQQIFLVVMADDVADVGHVAVAQRFGDDDPFQWEKRLLRQALIGHINPVSDAD